MLIGPSPTVVALLELPEGTEVTPVAMRREFDQNWYKVIHLRRTGWIDSTLVEELKKPLIIKQRRKLNFTGLSDREKDKIRMFENYDKEAATRAFDEVTGDDTKFLDRPIRRNGIPKYTIDEMKEEAYCRIEDIRTTGK